MKGSPDAEISKHRWEKLAELLLVWFSDSEGAVGAVVNGSGAV